MSTWFCKTRNGQNSFAVFLLYRYANCRKRGKSKMPSQCLVMVSGGCSPDHLQKSLGKHFFLALLFIHTDLVRQDPFSWFSRGFEQSCPDSSHLAWSADTRNSVALNAVKSKDRPLQAQVRSEVGWNSLWRHLTPLSLAENQLLSHPGA